MRLVTIASFDTVPQAHLARNELESAGIRAVITDEETTGMLWHFANALGGAKVQVKDEDAERAVAILDARFGEDESEADAAPSLDDQALAERREDGSDARQDEEPVASVADVERSDELNRREVDSKRLVLIAWLGILLPPLAFYALYVLGRVVFGKGALTRQARINLVAGMIWMIPCLVVMATGVLGVFFFLVASLFDFP
jgi:Putative prokaryotic signal transducing protein